MSDYPNYRVSVELIIKNNDKILLAKRADDADVAPGQWCVPAGKVKYDEIPIVAALREAKEETGLDIAIISEVSCRTSKIKSKGEDAYRLIYTYLVKPTTDDKEQINEEHSEFAWVRKDEVAHECFSSLSPNLRDIIMKNAF